jgi:hypothetical protein
LKRLLLGPGFLGGSPDILSREEFVRVGHQSRNPRQTRGSRQHGLNKVSTMRKKYGKFYADWTDETGHRKMKAFPTKKAALRFTAKMRGQVTAKKARASGPSATSAPRSPRPSRATKTK